VDGEQKSGAAKERRKSPLAIRHGAWQALKTTRRRNQSLSHAKGAAEQAWSKGLGGMARRGIGWLENQPVAGQDPAGVMSGTATGFRSIRE